MREVTQGFLIGGYLLMLVMAVGYAKLLIGRPAQRKIAFAAAVVTIAAGLTTVFQLIVRPDVLQQFAGIAVDYQLDRRPGTRELSRRHPEVRSSLERIAILSMSGAGTADDDFIAASTAYSEAIGKYQPAYLAVAADAELVNYAGAVASLLARLNDRSGFICGAFLNGRMATVVGAMNTGIDWSDLENARDAALLSAFVAPHALLLPDRTSQLDTDLTGFLERRYGPLRAKVLLNALAAPAPIDDPELCTALVVMVEYALALPPADRADMIRLMFQEAASSPPAAEPPAEESAPMTL